MTVLTSLDITIENPDLDEKKVTRDEDGMPIRSQVGITYRKMIYALHGQNYYAYLNHIQKGPRAVDEQNL